MVDRAKVLWVCDVLNVEFDEGYKILQQVGGDLKNVLDYYLDQARMELI
jgi:ABC-type polysaccharide transport system permease subunit